MARLQFAHHKVLKRFFQRSNLFVQIARHLVALLGTGSIQIDRKHVHVCFTEDKVNVVCGAIAP